jgi:phage shock protein PspC (stress-responsive transcriptional regulator)
VPSLVRFLTILAVLGAIAYGIMYALVTFVTPEPREMMQTISPTKLNK